MEKIKEAMQAVIKKELTPGNLRYRHMESTMRGIMEHIKGVDPEEARKRIEALRDQYMNSIKRNDGFEFDDARVRYWIAGQLSVAEAALAAAENS
jgi:hypothetical protein